MSVDTVDTFSRGIWRGAYYCWLITGWTFRLFYGHTSSLYHWGWEVWLQLPSCDITSGSDSWLSSRWITNDPVFFTRWNCYGTCCFYCSWVDFVTGKTLMSPTWCLSHKTFSGYTGKQCLNKHRTNWAHMTLFIFYRWKLLCELIQIPFLIDRFFPARASPVGRGG